MDPAMCGCVWLMIVVVWLTLVVVCVCRLGERQAGH